MEKSVLKTGRISSVNIPNTPKFKKTVNKIKSKSVGIKNLNIIKKIHNDNNDFNYLKKSIVNSNINKGNNTISEAEEHILITNSNNTINKSFLIEFNFLNLNTPSKYLIILPHNIEITQLPNIIKEVDYKLTQISPKLFENKTYQISFKTYKNAPDCIVKVLNNWSRSNNIKSANLIWKLYKFEKMIKLIPTLTKNQKYNHFPKTFQLGRKDHLWKNYKKSQTKFPKDFDYMPLTFIFPHDIQKFPPLKKGSLVTWIVKPVASSRGRGIHLLSDPSELNTLISKSQSKGNEYLISKYIDNPHTINEKKYDLRIYVLITSFTPIKIYFYEEGLVRFASENYTMSNKENIFVHLTNYAINKKNKNYERNEDSDDKYSNASKWSFKQYKEYFKEKELEKEYELIFERIKDIVIKTILSASDESMQVIRGIAKYKNSMFELYGFDIMIDDKFNPWLLEVNVSPSLNCDSNLDMKIKSDLITDTINIIGITFNLDNINTNVNVNESGNINNLISNNNLFKENKQNVSKFKIKTCKDFSMNKSNFEFTDEEKIYSNDISDYQEMTNTYISEVTRSQFGKFEMIFPKYKDRENIIYYSRFVNNPGDDNIILWKWILSNSF